MYCTVFLYRTIGEKLTAEFWPEYAAAHERERAKTKERRAAAEPAEKLVRAFKVGLDPPSTAVYGPKRPISPVQWSRLEVAKAMNENHGAARGAKQAAAGGLRRPMTARARIQSNGGGSDTSEGESGGAFTARKLQRRVMVAKSQLRPSIQRSDADVQLPVSTDTAGKYLVPAEEVLGTFITQQGSSQIGPQLEEVGYGHATGLDLVNGIFVVDMFSFLHLFYFSSPFVSPTRSPSHSLSLSLSPSTHSL